MTNSSRIITCCKGCIFGLEIDELLVSGTGKKEADATMLCPGTVEELSAALLRSGTEELDAELFRSGKVEELDTAFKRSGTDNKELYISTPPLKKY